METKSENFAKQCSISDNRVINNKSVIKEETVSLDVSAINFDEPIDLTNICCNIQPFSHNNIHHLNISDFDRNLPSQSQPTQYYPVQNAQNNPMRKFRKRRSYTIGIPESFRSYPGAYGYHNIHSKQEEILMAAKSLFSKRTRTLYHWMYPNAPKQQIKSAVATSWGSLGNQEREFYVSQVLGRFGFPPCSLMVNPQLGGIKNLPPLPQPRHVISTPQNELESAISSISSNSSNSLNLDSFSERFHRIKKKKGRPYGSKNKRIKTERNVSVPQEFHDDPELKREFEQYALNLRQT